MGGGAKYENGQWSDPSFKVKTVNADGDKEDKNYTNVAAAFEGVGTSITNVQNKVTNDITNKFNEFTQNITNITQQVKGDALLWSRKIMLLLQIMAKMMKRQIVSLRPFGWHYFTRLNRCHHG
ncbi:hypothetical protein [Bartonella raoultii]|uniref:Trimeric autotransporter adhesin YadA-like stalk domain-containing protein n=1 Tax=Bartonella raoultii TaxID=1457020 RepID=A0ABS7I6N1_9HYPH|nr:hypothetical protein [Bartonella raoultii]MBX4336574.1 hypothetical protein [Bartonella raoultii]